MNTIPPLRLLKTITRLSVAMALLSSVFLAAQNDLLRGRSGGVVGKLISPDGMSVAGIRVVAIESSDTNPSRTLAATTFMSSAQTDSAGAYRLETIFPGTYYIVADPLGYPTYYPGASTMAGATAITVTAGATITARDLTLVRLNRIVQTVRTPAQTPDGRYFGKISTAWGTALSNVTLILADSLGKTRAMTAFGEDGAFEFPAVRAGEYSVELLSAMKDRSAPQGYEELKTAIAMQTRENMQQDFKLRLVTGNLNSRLPATAPTRPDLYVAAKRSTRPPGAPPLRTLPSLLLDRYVVREIAPIYPESAQKAKLEGEVLLECVFAVDGSAISVRVVSPDTNPEFARAAIEAASHWRYVAAANADPTEVMGTLSIPFNLDTR